MFRESTERLLVRIQNAAWSVRLLLASLDERGGGRNTDEGFHISAGAIIAGTIAAGVAAFVADKLGVLR